MLHHRKLVRLEHGDAGGISVIRIAKQCDEMIPNPKTMHTTL
jgi:hypothetical protein